MLLPYDAIVAIRAEGQPAGGGERAHALDIAFAEAVAAIAGDRPRVLVVARDGSGLSGELRSVGRDVATLRLADATGVVYVPLASMAELAIVGPRPSRATRRRRWPGRPRGRGAPGCRARCGRSG